MSQYYYRVSECVNTIVSVAFILVFFYLFYLPHNFVDHYHKIMISFIDWMIWCKILPCFWNWKKDKSLICSCAIHILPKLMTVILSHSVAVDRRWNLIIENLHLNFISSFVNSHLLLFIYQLGLFLPKLISITFITPPI